MLQAEKFTK